MGTTGEGEDATPVETSEPDDGFRSQRGHRGRGAFTNARTAARKNARTCIVTRQKDPPEGLIRFVADPDGKVVPDLHAKLPGRGAHVTARYALVERAARRHMFKRALKADVEAAPDLADEVAELLRADLVRTLPLLRKAGDLVVGAGKVESLVRSGEALLVLHADEAASDGVRKIDQARHAVRRDGGPDIPSNRTFTEEELGLAFGGDRVIHAAVPRTTGGERFAERLRDYASYCNDAEKGRHEPRGDANHAKPRPT